MKAAAKYLAIIILSLVCLKNWAQDKFEIPKMGFTIYPYKDSTINIRFLGLMQFWSRYGEANAGSIYKGDTVNSISDLSLRRLSLITAFEITPKFLLMVNVNSNGNASNNPQQVNLNFSIIDGYGEYSLSDKLSIGAGLHLWNGFSRLNLENVGTLTNLDVPKFQAPYFNQLDKLNRMFGIYARGRLRKLDYRISVNDPFTPTSTNTPANNGFGSPSGGLLHTPSNNSQLNVAYFNPAAQTKMFMGYFKWQFLSKEFNKIPFENGDYIGQKRVFNIGAGFAYRKNGMLVPTKIELRNSALPESSSNPKILIEAKHHDILCLAVDAFLSHKLSAKNDGITMYLGYFSTDMGPNFYTVSSTNQISTYANNPKSNINGSGLASPASGTGNTFYVVTGYHLPNNFPVNNTQFGLFATVQHSNFKALKAPITIYEGGVNWFISGHGLKLTLQYRNRPVLGGIAAYDNFESTATQQSRKREFILQAQVNF